MPDKDPRRASERSRQWVRDHPEQKKATDKAYRESHAREIAVGQARYREAHREELARAQRERQAKKKEEIGRDAFNERRREDWANNPGKREKARVAGKLRYRHRKEFLNEAQKEQDKILDSLLPPPTKGGNDPWEPWEDKIVLEPHTSISSKCARTGRTRKAIRFRKHVLTNNTMQKRAAKSGVPRMKWTVALDEKLLRLVGEGFDNYAIAAELGCSYNAVACRLSRLR